MREKFESEAWCYEVGRSSGKSSNRNIQGKEAAGEMSSKGIKRGEEVSKE